MKKEQRLPYLILTDITLPNSGSAILCGFCKYAEWEGSCDDGDVNCKHPLWKVNEDECEHAVIGGDCFGFVTNVSPEDAVDMVGIWLQGKAVDSNSIPSYKPPSIKRKSKQLKLAIVGT